MEIANITSRQRKLLTKLQTGNPDLSFSWQEARGALSFARGADLALALPRDAIESEASRSDRLTALMEEHGELFGLTGDGKGLHLQRTRTDNLDFSYHEYQQFADTKDGDGLPPSIAVDCPLRARWKAGGGLVLLLSGRPPHKQHKGGCCFVAGKCA